MKRFVLGVFFVLGLAWATTYTVQPGDTLWRISQDNHVDLTALILANRLTGNQLKPGQRLLIPSEYTVAAGDTLWSLARRFGTSVEEIKRLNGLSGSELRVGQRLWIAAHIEEPAAGDAARIARAYLGRPYRYGGAGPDSFDCSGLVQFVYRKLGVSLPRTSAAQWSSLPPTPQPRPGDLVFFSFSGNRVDHVGIYLGNGRFVHANSHRGAVMVEDMNAPWYRKVYLGARRVEMPKTAAAR